MSDQEKEKRLLNIINYFKSSTRTVSDLKELLEHTGESSDESVLMEHRSENSDENVSTTANVDALVVLTSDALPEAEGFIDFYRSYKGNTTQGRTTRAYLNIKRIEGEKYKPIKEEWKEYINGKIQLNTELTTVLKHIMDFINQLPGSNQAFKEFLTGIQSNISSEDLIDGSVDKDAKKIISGAIETSAKKCVVFTGAPGTGKTYCVEEYVKRVTGQDGKNRAPHPNWEFVQFHSSYDYTDFVEGLRPVQIDRKMEFVRMDGIFKAFCRRAARKEKEEKEKKEEKKEKFYFIIDEINRADLGRVFGELMYCFEKRGEKHRITTPYANLPTCDKHGEPLGNPLEDENGNPLQDKDGTPLRDNDGCFEGGFYIPDNVIIIGTMNDIDRSVETFDFALRRRFDWVEIEADAVMKSSLTAIMEKKLVSEERELTDDENKFIADLVSELLPKIKAKKDDKGAIGGLNGIIETQSGLGKEFKIGPAYFKDYDVEKGFESYKEAGVLNQENHKKNLNAVWKLNIEPVLREYVRGRQGADEFIAKCKGALLSEKNEGKGGNSQDAEPQENKDGADAQPGEQK